MQVGTNTEFPSHLGDIPETVKVPDGNVFKFVLYGVGVLDYKFNASDSTWKVCKGETFLSNNPKSPLAASSIVATTSSTALDQYGNTHKGLLKSLIPGDTSSAIGHSKVFEYDAASNIIHWSLGEIKSAEGVFSDITYMLGNHKSSHDLSVGTYPDGHVRSVTIDIITLCYGKE